MKEAVCGKFLLLTRGPDGPALRPPRSAFILATRAHLDALHLGQGQRTDTAAVPSALSRRPCPPAAVRCCHHQPCPAHRPLLSSSALSRRPLAAVIIKVALHPVIALPLLIDLVTCWPFLVRDAHIGAVWCVRVECGVLVWAVSTFVIIDPCALECSTNM